MKLEFDDGKHPYRFEFIFRRQFPNCIDVVAINRDRPRGGSPAHSAWLICIDEGKIKWTGGEEEFLHLTQGAKDYANKIVKLLAFV